jgi:hypothetical protein
MSHTIELFAIVSQSFFKKNYLTGITTLFSSHKDFLDTFLFSCVYDH